MRLSLALATTLLGFAAQAADPAWYAKKATWHETARASLEALARQEPSAARRVPLPDLGRSPFTVTAWVRTKVGGTIFATAPAQGNWARQGKSFFIRGGKLAFDVGWVGCVNGRAQVADGQWHHVAVTKGDQLRFYVDGQPDATGTLEFQPDPAGHVARLGTTSPNFPDRSHFQGELDDVRVYARALGDAEVLADREKPQGGLVARWPFDADGADATGNGNDVGKGHMPCL